MRFPSRLLPVIGVVLTAACVTTPRKPVSDGTVDRGQWASRIQIVDKAKAKTHRLSVEIIGERAGPLRLEASGPLGYPVATLVTDQRSFRCVVYSGKRFYEGPADGDALRGLLRMPVSPRVLSKIVFEEPLGGDWKCLPQGSRMPDVCQSARLDSKIQWKRQDGGRVVQIESPEVAMTWSLGEARTEVQVKDETFRLEAPVGFKVIRL